MSNKVYVEIVLGVMAVVGAIYKFAQTEHRIYASIDKVNDELREHVLSCDANEQLTNYKLDRLSEQIACLLSSGSK
jgi:hypothetical protein